MRSVGFLQSLLLKCLVLASQEPKGTQERITRETQELLFPKMHSIVPWYMLLSCLKKKKKKVGKLNIFIITVII